MHPALADPGLVKPTQLGAVVCSQPGVWVSVSAIDLPELLPGPSHATILLTLTMFPDDVLHLAFGSRWQVRDELIILALGASLETL